MTYAELGRRAKAKYPQYSNIPDDELGRLLVNKYPQYQAQITEGTALVIRPNTAPQVLSPSYPASVPAIENRIAKLRGRLDSDSHFFLGWRTGHIRKQIDHLQASLDKTRLTFGAEQFEAERALALRQIVLQLATIEQQIHSLAALAKREDQATLEGMDVERYADVSQQRALAALEVEKHRQLKQIDFEDQQRNLRLEIEAAMTAKEPWLAQQQFILNKLLELIDQRWQLLTSGQDESLVAYKVRVIDEVIDQWRDRLNAGTREDF